MLWYNMVQVKGKVMKNLINTSIQIFKFIDNIINNLYFNIIGVIVNLFTAFIFFLLFNIFIWVFVIENVFPKTTYVSTNLLVLLITIITTLATCLLYSKFVFSYFKDRKLYINMKNNKVLESDWIQ